MNEILSMTPKGKEHAVQWGHEAFTKIHTQVQTDERAHLREQRNNRGESEVGRQIKRLFL